ncbi:MAG: HEAT repeat domain-containing protein [Treponema sp.]|nr:HEAT repeat domain-containing protein [Treponema sp.]
MYHLVVNVLLFLSAAAIIFLLVYNVAKRILIAGNKKRSAAHKKAIVQKIESFIAGTEAAFKNGLDQIIKDAAVMDKSYIETVEEYLLAVLENSDLNYRERYITIARRLGFTDDCLPQIKSPKPEISAAGCRRAGLYRLENAAPDMFTALDILSGENQFEILLGLARIGNADYLQRAFEKIRDCILVNERAAIQILVSFPKGDEKTKLFKQMLNCGSDYITAVFLKAMTSDMAALLAGDIIQILAAGSKEVRTAAVRSLSTLGRHAPAAELIRAMEDHDWEVRTLAARALAPVYGAEAAMALYNGLFDQQWWVRQNSAQSLAGHPGYEPLFILAAEAGDEYAKDSIINVLEKIGDPVLLRSIKIMAA